MFLLILERGREREKHRFEKHQSVASHRRPYQGSIPQPWHVSWQGIKSENFWCIGWCFNQLSHLLGQFPRFSYAQDSSYNFDYRQFAHPRELSGSEAGAISWLLWLLLASTVMGCWVFLLLCSISLHLATAGCWRSVTNSSFLTPGSQLGHCVFIFILFFKDVLIYLEKGGWRGRGEGDISICFSTYLCIHWLILVCALTGDQTCNLGYQDDTVTNRLPGQG